MRRVNTEADANIVLGKKYGVIRPYPKTACCDVMSDFLVEGAEGGDFFIDFGFKHKLVRGSKSVKEPFNNCPWCGIDIVFFYDDKLMIEEDQSSEMSFKPSAIKEEDYKEAVSRAPKQDDIYAWLKEASTGFYSLDDELDCPQIGGEGSSCGLSSKIRSRASSLERKVSIRHDKKKKKLLLNIED